MILMTIAMVFDYSKKNFYGLTPLVATIDSDKELEEIQVLLQENLDALNLRKLLNQVDQLIVGFSFRTAQLPEIYERMENIYSSLNSSELKKKLIVRSTWRSHKKVPLQNLPKTSAELQLMVNMSLIEAL